MTLGIAVISRSMVIGKKTKQQNKPRAAAKPPKRMKGAKNERTAENYYRRNKTGDLP